MQHEDGEGQVTVPNTDRQVATEIVRENSLGKEHIDGWRQYIARMEPTDYRFSARFVQ